jgi:branched-chain amino acid transport system permease protein
VIGGKVARKASSFGVSRAQAALAASAVVLLGVSPLFVDRSTVSLLFYLMMWVCLAQSFNLFTGLTGYVNFGNVVFYGVGAYAAAVAMALWDASPYLAVLLGGAFSALLALGMSFPTLRLRGAYFAIATLSIQQAVFVLFDNWGYVNTAAGISIPVKFYDPVLQYYAMLVVSVATVAAFFVVSRSRVGKALKAIRLQEETALSIGINSTLYKTTAFVISGFFAGLGGGTAIWNISFIDPTSGFPGTITLTVISMAMLGGLGTLIGPMIGSLILYVTGYYLLLQYPYLHLIMFGAIIMAVVLVLPNGIVGFVRGRMGVGHGVSPVLRFRRLRGTRENHEPA